MKMAVMASLQGFRRAVDRWGGRGGRGGASWGVGEAWGGRWPRWFSSAAAGAFGEENRGGGECSGKREGAAREEEERGDTRRRRGVARETGGSRRWPSRVEVARAAASRCPSSWQGGRRQEKGGLGRAGPVLLGHQVGFTGKSPGMCSLLCFIVLFSFINIFCHCFEFKQIQTMPKTPLNILFC